MKRLLILAVSLAGCNQTTINTPTRVFDRPSDVALSCRQVTLDPATSSFVFDARPISDCSPERLLELTPTDADGVPLLTDTGFSEGPILAAVVAQSARGEVTLVDVFSEHVVDLQAAVPGFGFLPVGKLPEHVRVSTDGCLAATANVDSCDLAVLDMATLYNMPFLPYRSPAPAPDFAKDVVRRLTPTVGGKPLGSRPTWIEFSSYTAPALRGWEKAADGTPLPGATPGQCLPRATGTPTEYRAWIALPGCALVAEVDISAAKANPGGFTPAEVVRALRFGPSGVEVVSDLSTISCPSECDGTDVVNGGPPASDDGGVPDGGTRLPTSQAQPTTIALDSENGLSRLFVGDRTGDRITIVPFDAASGNLGTPHQLQLEASALGVSVVRVSPRSEAGKFLYAVARDATVRVVDLDREAECETNPDPRALQAIPPSDPLDRVRFFGCFPLGDPATPPRSPLNTSPGIELPGLALPKDVTFVHTDAPPPGASNVAPPAAGPSTLVGDYAWIISSDGRATVVNIFDACPAPNQPQLFGDGVTYTPACSPLAADPSRAQTYVNNFGHPLPMALDRVSHRLRGGASRFFQAANPSDNVGQPRLTDETNPFLVSINNVAKASSSMDLNSLPSLQSAPFPTLPSPFPALPAAINQRYVNFFDPDRVRSETWTLAWEGVLPGTHRTLAAVDFVAGTTHPALLDNGASFCSRGVQAGDKVVFTGCDKDEDCGYLDFCVRDPAAPADVQAGMCLPRAKAQELQDTCKDLLRALRRYRILSAKQGAHVNAAVDASGISDILELGEIYEPEHPVETRSCASDIDCSTVKVLDAKGENRLATSCLEDADGVHRCLRACKPAGTEAEQSCGKDFLCLNSRFGDGRCLVAPLNATQFETCMGELQTYEVRAGEAFIVEGSLTGMFADLQANPVTRECEIPPESSEYTRLHQSRIPIEPAAQCPPSISSAGGDPLSALPNDFLDPVTGIATNVCQVSPGVTPRPGNPVNRTLHFENPLFSFLVRVGAGPLSGPPSPSSNNDGGVADADGGTNDDGGSGGGSSDGGTGTGGGASTMETVPPDLLTISFSLVGSGFPLGLALAVDVQAQQPRACVTAPDRQTVFVVDEGKQSVGVGLRGQLLKLSSDAVAIDRTFQVR